MTPGPERRLNVASLADIRAGRITDVYFQRALEIMRAKPVDRVVRAEIVVKSFPDDWQWAILAGLDEAITILEGLPISVRSLREGTAFETYQPVIDIVGRYSDFAALETALLGVISQASGIATRAARCKKLADGRLVASFGARRLHPAIAPMIERNAFIGGCDGVSVVATAESLGEEPMGTMPHALILLFGDTLEATRAFDEVIDPSVRRVALIDTFQDEKFEAMRVAAAMGQRLFAIRLDTPASRRGDFKRIIEEVRWELALRGLGHVKMFVSGGITERHIRALNPVADAYGIGAEISGAPPVDFSLDIVEIDGKPAAKRGKMSGGKNLWRCPECGAAWVLPFQETPPDHAGCNGSPGNLLQPLLQNGSPVYPDPSPQSLRQYVLAQLAQLPI